MENPYLEEVLASAPPSPVPPEMRKLTFDRYQLRQRLVLERDQVWPRLSGPVSPGLTVALVRVSHRRSKAAEPVPFGTTKRSTSDLYVGQSRVVTAGDIKIDLANDPIAQVVVPRAHDEPLGSPGPFGPGSGLRMASGPSGSLMLPSR